MFVSLVVSTYDRAVVFTDRQDNSKQFIKQATLARKHLCIPAMSIPPECIANSKIYIH